MSWRQTSAPLLPACTRLTARTSSTVSTAPAGPVSAPPPQPSPPCTCLPTLPHPFAPALPSPQPPYTCPRCVTLALCFHLRPLSLHRSGSRPLLCSPSSLLSGPPNPPSLAYLPTLISVLPNHPTALLSRPPSPWCTLHCQGHTGLLAAQDPRSSAVMVAGLLNTHLALVSGILLSLLLAAAQGLSHY